MFCSASWNNSTELVSLLLSCSLPIIKANQQKKQYGKHNAAVIKILSAFLLLSLRPHLAQKSHGLYSVSAFYYRNSNNKGEKINKKMWGVILWTSVKSHNLLSCTQTVFQTSLLPDLHCNSNHQDRLPPIVLCLLKANILHNTHVLKRVFFSSEKCFGTWIWASINSSHFPMSLQIWEFSDSCQVPSSNCFCQRSALALSQKHELLLSAVLTSITWRFRIRCQVLL